MCNTSSREDEGDLSEGLVSHISCLLSVYSCIVMGFIFLFHREEKGINSMKNKYPTMAFSDTEQPNAI